MKKNKFKVGDYVVVTTKVFDNVERTICQYGLSGYITDIEESNQASLPIWVKYDERSCLEYNSDMNTYNPEHLDYHPITKTKLYKALK